MCITVVVVCMYLRYSIRINTLPKGFLSNETFDIPRAANCSLSAESFVPLRWVWSMNDDVDDASLNPFNASFWPNVAAKNWSPLYASPIIRVPHKPWYIWAIHHTWKKTNRFEVISWEFKRQPKKQTPKTYQKDVCRYLQKLHLQNFLTLMKRHPWLVILCCGNVYIDIYRQQNKSHLQRNNDIIQVFAAEWLLTPYHWLLLYSAYNAESLVYLTFRKFSNKTTLFSSVVLHFYAPACH